MKKVLSFALVLTMVLAFTVPTMAANVKVVGEKDGAVLISQANEWSISVPAAGTVVVQDNKAKFEFVFDAEGTYSLGLQKNYTGQLRLVSFEAVAELTYVDVLTGYAFEKSLVRQSTGNLSDLTITVTETWERQWSNGDVDALPDEIGFETWSVPNNVDDDFDVTVNLNTYTFHVVIRGGGNAEFTVTDITE